jgi:hypothetical protein
LVETDGAGTGSVQPAQETVSASGTESAITAPCPMTAMAGWPPWTVVVVGTDRRHVAGTVAGLEPAMRGPAPGAPMEPELEPPVELAPSEMVPRAEPWMAPRSEPQMTPQNVGTVV